MSQQVYLGDGNDRARLKKKDLRHNQDAPAGFKWISPLDLTSDAREFKRYQGEGGFGEQGKRETERGPRMSPNEIGRAHV